MSHRSKEFMEIAVKTEEDLRTLMDIPEEFEVLFTGGGATAQFAAIPMNLMNEKKKGNYLVTGSWSKGAVKDAKKCGEVNEVIEPLKSYTTCPKAEDWNIADDADYFYFCDNETIYGVELHDFPFDKVEGQLLIADCSSNFGSKKIDWSKYGCVYAGAQKNLGPAGVCVVIVRKDLIGKERSETPVCLSWDGQAKAAGKFLNTPCCWSLYVLGLTLEHMLANGGLEAYDALAAKKSSMLYDFIDGSDGYYTNPVDVPLRSRMNIPFRVKCDDDLEKKFIAGAKEIGLIELKGHRTVGGIRASIYNSMPVEGV